MARLYELAYLLAERRLARMVSRGLPAGRRARNIGNVSA